MYFRELSQLQEANPDLANIVAKLDKYLARLQGKSRNHIAVTDVAQQIGAPRDKVLGLLMAAAQLRLLKLKFRVSCPVHGHGIKDYAEIKDVPSTVYCDVCDDEHELTGDDVEYFFELAPQALPITG
jgi:hypothetical protein